MACLNWKSDALATVIRPLPKGTGDPPKRHLRGNTLKSRVEDFDSAFFVLAIASSQAKSVRERGALLQAPLQRFHPLQTLTARLTCDLNFFHDNRIPT